MVLFLFLPKKMADNSLNLDDFTNVRPLIVKSPRVIPSCPISGGDFNSARTCVLLAPEHGLFTHFSLAWVHASDVKPN